MFVAYFSGKYHWHVRFQVSGYVEDEVRTHRAESIASFVLTGITKQKIGIVKENLINFICLFVYVI